MPINVSGLSSIRQLPVEFSRIVQPSLPNFSITISDELQGTGLGFVVKV